MGAAIEELWKRRREEKYEGEEEEVFKSNEKTMRSPDVGQRLGED